MTQNVMTKMWKNPKCKKLFDDLTNAEPKMKLHFAPEVTACYKFWSDITLWAVVTNPALNNVWWDTVAHLTKHYFKKKKEQDTVEVVAI